MRKKFTHFEKTFTKKASKLSCGHIENSFNNPVGKNSVQSPKKFAQGTKVFRNPQKFSSRFSRKTFLLIRRKQIWPNWWEHLLKLWKFLLKAGKDLWNYWKFQKLAKNKTFGNFFQKKSFFMWKSTHPLIKYYQKTGSPKCSWRFEEYSFDNSKILSLKSEAFLLEVRKNYKLASLFF